MKEREYKHKLSNFLVDPLFALSRQPEGKGRISRIGITHPQIANFSKLKYWGFVDKIGGGDWAITHVGWEFIRGRLQVYEYVHTYSDKRLRFSGNLISIKDIGNDYWQRNEYVKNSTRITAEEKDQTGDLFR